MVHTQSADHTWYGNDTVVSPRSSLLDQDGPRCISFKYYVESDGYLDVAVVDAFGNSMTDRKSNSLVITGNSQMSNYVPFQMAQIQTQFRQFFLVIKSYSWSYAAVDQIEVSEGNCQEMGEHELIFELANFNILLVL